MKRIFAVLFPLFPLLIYAQPRVGIRAGVNAPLIDFAGYHPPRKPLWSMNAGFIAAIPIDDRWTIYTGPYYSGKGMIFHRSPSTNKIDSFTIRLNYIELPVTIGYRFSPEKENGLTVIAGPYLSYGFNGKMYQRNDRKPTTHLHKKEKDQYKRLDVGFDLAALYEINARYGVRFDYTRSLSGIYRNINPEEKEKNSVFGFSVFWYFKSKESD